MKIKFKSSAYVYAQHRYLWSGFWVLPYVMLAMPRSVDIDIGFLWWLWEIRGNCRAVARSPVHFGGYVLLPAILLQKTQDARFVCIKFFFWKWHGEWEI